MPTTAVVTRPLLSAAVITLLAFGAARAHRPSASRGVVPMPRIARHPAVGRAAGHGGERRRLPRQRRAHGARHRRRCGATAISRRPRTATRPTWLSASTSRMSAPTASDLSDRLRAAGYGNPGDGWRAGEDLGWGTGERATPNALVDAWLDSDQHRRILLSAGYQRDRRRRRRRARRRRRTPACPARPTPWTSGRSGLDRLRGMTATAPSGARYGVTSMVAPLQRVLVRRPALRATGTAPAGGHPTRPRSSASTRRSSSCSTASAPRSRSRTRSTARSTRSTCTTR